MSGLARTAGWVFTALAGLHAPDAIGERLAVAVASNFRPAMEALAPEFEARSEAVLTLSYGSSGKHYAQIVNGAPFEIFLSADEERPRLLEAGGQAVAGSRFVYAIGRLALWQPRAQRREAVPQALDRGDFRFLVMANPRTAPYGLAAEQVLRHMGLWERLQPRIARAENVAQAFSYVKSGNAELGFVALSQLAARPEADSHLYWVVPQEYYRPIEQHAVLLSDSESARSFVDFLRSEDAAVVILAHGYGVPQ